MTVCPPRGANTALNYDLMKADNESLTGKQRKELKLMIKPILIEPSHLEYIRKVVAVTNHENLIQIYNGVQSFPKEYLGGTGFVIRMWNNTGTWHTPGFHEEYNPSYYTGDKHHHVAIDFPKNLRDEMGSGFLVIQLEVDTREEEGWQEYVEYTAQRTKLYGEERDRTYWSAAEAHCQRDGGHLASILSEEDQQEVKAVANTTKYVWVGGSVLSEERVWRWSDGSPWAYAWWRDGYSKRGKPHNCLQMFADGQWGDSNCGYSSAFVCQSEPIKLRGNTTLTFELGREELTFPAFHIWYRYNFTSQQLLDTWMGERMTGFKVTWFLKNTSVTNLNLTPQTHQSYIVSMATLANHARVNLNMSREDLITRSINAKAAVIQGNSLQYTSMCFNGQINQKSIGKIYNLTDFGLSKVSSVLPLTDEDIETAVLMFSVIVYCSESIALSQFLHSLLSSQSPRTIIQATVNTIEAGDIKERSNMKRMAEIYLALDKIFHFQHGKILLATVSSSELKDMMSKDWPYFSQYSQEIDLCFNNTSCQGVSDLVKSLGKYRIRIISLLGYLLSRFCQCGQQSQPPPSPPD